jgi:hypothetical protein
MNLIEQAIEGQWGERCPDYEEGCLVCEAWREYDNLVRVVRSTYLDADGNYYPDADFNDAVRDALAQLKKELK